LNVQLVTQSSEAKAILQQFKNEIIQTLQSSGLTVSDFKIDQSPLGQSQSFDQRGFENKNQSFTGSDKQFGSEQNQKKDESDKRNELWRILQEREVA
jgi:flagellar hook-length control protein FliK